MRYTAQMTSDADRAAESLLAFWRDAGVDVLVEDAPVDRTLTQTRPEVRPLVAAPRPLADAPVARGPDLSQALADAHRLAAEAADLTALEAAIAAFEGCPLRYEGARRAVFARGNPQADVIVIGEAPGADEDAQGKPFVGRAGQLLDRMLDAAGLQDRVFITNTVYWRPPGNRTPSPQEQAVCAPFLERAITLIKPRILLLVGAASAKSVLKRNEGILALRGNWFEWRAEQGGLTIPALPTLHPAFLLRQPQAKKKAWSDLLSLAARLDRDPADALQTEV
jgi:DNA polymerase